MSMSTWVDPRVASVRVANVRSYLLERGWHMQTDTTDHLLVFDGPLDDDGERVIQVVPASESLRDYRQRIVELIASLSIMENRSTIEILDDLLRRRADDHATHPVIADALSPATPSRPAENKPAL